MVLKKMKILLRKVIIPAGVLGVLTLLGWLVMQLNLFYVQTIEVIPLTGNVFKFVDKSAIDSAVLSFEGKRIFSIRTKDVENTVLRTDPFVRVSYVAKRLPSTIIVRIEEKLPVAIVREGNINQIEQVLAGPILDTDIVIDEEGENITDCTANRKACVKLPLLIIPSNNSDLADTLVYGDIDNLFELIQQLKDKKVAVSGFGTVESGVALVSFSDSTRGVFNLDEVEKSLSAYLLTRESVIMEGRSFKEIDVRFDRPVVRVDKYSEWVIE